MVKRDAGAGFCSTSAVDQRDEKRTHCEPATPRKQGVKAAKKEQAEESAVVKSGHSGKEQGTEAGGRSRPGSQGVEMTEW